MGKGAHWFWRFGVGAVIALMCGTLRALTMADNSHSQAPLGLFDSHGDIGVVLLPGSAIYDAEKKTYTVSASGENMWFKTDAYHFVWKKVEGDISLSADITFLGSGKNPHRKACLIVRQSLDAGSAYADAALHGDGLAALQYRDAVGENTHDIHSNVNGPNAIRLDKHGDTMIMSVSGPDGSFVPAGGSVRVELKGSYYVGIGVCSHEKDLVEAAVFSNVRLGPSTSSATPTLYSTLETVAIASTDRTVVHVFKEHMEAPNWTPDGKSLIYNANGHLFRIPAGGGEPAAIDTGFANRCNNDHGISPDGTQLVVSDQSQPPGQSIIYTLPIQGGAPKKITDKFPSYWHGWSPDGKTLAFCGQRDGKFGIFTIPATGGDETRLTTTDGLDDGPDYSPDGKNIYFNSDRTGLMQIWRMAPDGTQLEQLTKDDANNWFGHVSPNGKWMVYLTYGKDVKGHPANKDVMLRLMSLSDGKITVLAKLFGGQGTINVPSWSPDSAHVAFVSYQLIH
jgi:Tol biopolymer transport system component